jgi:sugar/nucleoside kinase (ribokinase family)
MPAFHLDEFIDLLGFCRENGVVTVVDVVVPQNVSLPKDISPLLCLVDIFLPNNDEACLLTGLTDTEDQLRAFLSMGANTVFITQGRRGVLAGRGHEYWKAGVFEMELIDPSGSGDAFDAGVITSILRGWDVPQTIRYASALGASAIRRLGTTDGVFTGVEAEEFIRTHPLDVHRGTL